MFISKIKEVSCTLPKSHHGPGPALPGLPVSGRTSTGVTLDPTALLQPGLPRSKSRRCSARPCSQDDAAWLRDPRGGVGFNWFPGSVWTQSWVIQHCQLCPYPGPGTACRTLSTRPVKLLALSLHLPLSPRQQGAELLRSPYVLATTFFFFPLFPHPMASPSLLPFLSTPPLIKY